MNMKTRIIILVAVSVIISAGLVTFITSTKNYGIIRDKTLEIERLTNVQNPRRRYPEISG